MSRAGRFLYWLARLIFGALFHTVFHLRIRGSDLVPKSGPVLVVANHISLADPPLLGVAIPRPLLFMAMSELFQHRWLGGFVRAVGSIPVDRSRTDFGAARQAIRKLREGWCVVIFPEGGIRRGAESVLGNNPQLRPGAETIARLSRAAVLPVILRGADAALHIRGWLRRATIEVTFGQPFCLCGETQTGQDREDLELVRRELLKTVALAAARD